MKKLLERIRPMIFWSLDYIKGSKLRTHIKDIDDIFKNYPSSDSLRKIDNRLNNLLEHAVSSTAFYQEYKGYKSIVDFPIVNKNIIRDNYEDFTSSKYPIESLISIFTSGSTGTPFKVLQNRDKRIRNSADAIYFSHFGGFELGRRLYHFRNWGDISRKERVTCRIQNVIPQDVLDLSPENLTLFLERLKQDKSTIGFIGFASAYEAICRYMDTIGAEQTVANIKSIIAIADPLNEYTKCAMRKYFKAQVVSRYSNHENGIVAQQRIGDNSVFHVNVSSYYVELLNLKNDLPAPDDEPGRIVLTDLFNYGTPIIRYDTGDVGIVKNNIVKGYGLNAINHIEGRRKDLIFNTSGQVIPFFPFSDIINKYPEIKQFQFIQEEKEIYRIILNSESVISNEDSLKNELKEKIGHDASITIEYVNEIPLLESGKRKIVINNYRTD